MTLTRSLETGGVSSYIRNLSKHLSRFNNDIYIVSTDKKDTKYTNPNITVLIKETKKKTFLNALSFLFFLIKSSKNNKIELFHANTPLSCLFASVAKIGNKKMKIIRTVHGNWTNELKTRKNTRELYGGYIIQKLLPKISRNIEKFELRKSDYIICVSDELKEHVRLIAPEKRISVISGGVDTDVFYPLKNKNKIKKSFGFPNKKIILYVGLINRIKGIEFLLMASEDIKDIDFEVIVAGKGPDINYYKEMKRKMKTDNVKFLGFVKDEKMNKLFNSADVFCLPSKWEGLPLTLLEAMSSGIVCVATDVGDISKVINNRNGFIVQKNNYNIFLKTLKKAIINSNNLKIKKEARRTVVKDYSYYVISKKIDEVYKKI